VFYWLISTSGILLLFFTFNSVIILEAYVTFATYVIQWGGVVLYLVPLLLWILAETWTGDDLVIFVTGSIMWLWNLLGSLIYLPKLQAYFKALPECELKSGLFACDDTTVTDLSDLLYVDSNE
jgi:hypothetical protein